MSSTNTRYKQIVHDNNNQSFGTNTTRWPSYDSRWDDPNRILCLAAGAGDILALEEEGREDLINQNVFSFGSIIYSRVWIVVS